MNTQNEQIKFRRELVTKIKKHEFASRLASLRKIKKLTQKELAKKIGVSNNTLSLWEDETNSKLPRSLETLLTLCYELDTKPYYLLCGLFEERNFNESEKKYKDIYSKYKSNTDFRMILEVMLILNDREIESMASFFESIYKRPLAERR